MSETNTSAPSRDDFASMLEASLAGRDLMEGTVVRGTVTAVLHDTVVIDVGLKTEGRVALREFTGPGSEAPKLGDQVDIYLERIENAMGEAVLSRDKARREEAWDRLEKTFESKEPVNGAIVGRVKGGFTVDLGGASAFLPGSQVDIRPVRDVAPLMNKEQPFAILKMDRPRGNIVVSRRAVLEESRAEQRAELVGQLAEGEVREGVVKNITDYGAFVDLGGIDGLLHVTDMSWSRVGHPSEVVEVGQTVQVQIIKINKDTQRISLGMKQLQSDPWDGVALKYPNGAVFKGRVTNIAEYGAFVELEPGVEGLVHVSEMDWTNKNVHPSKVVQVGDEVEVMVLDIDEERRRISLGIKQCQQNPWDAFAATHSKGDRIAGTIKSITDFGIFIGLEGNIDGLVHLSDISWNETGEEAVRSYKKGDEIETVILSIDPERERISLGIKQLEDDPFSNYVAVNDRGTIVTGEVVDVEPKAVVVKLAEEVEGILKASDISRDRVEDARNSFKVGDSVEAKIVSVDRKNRNVALSIKAKDYDDEKEAVKSLKDQEEATSPGTIGDLIKQQMNGN